MNFLNAFTAVITAYIVYYAGNILWDTYKAKQMENGRVTTREVFNAADEVRTYAAENRRHELTPSPKSENPRSEIKDDDSADDDPSAANDGISIVGQYDTMTFVDQLASMPPDKAEEMLNQQKIYYTTETFSISA